MLGIFSTYEFPSVHGENNNQFVIDYPCNITFSNKLLVIRITLFSIDMSTRWLRLLSDPLSPSLDVTGCAPAQPEKIGKLNG